MRWLMPGTLDPDRSGLGAFGGAGLRAGLRSLLVIVGMALALAVIGPCLTGPSTGTAAEPEKKDGEPAKPEKAAEPAKPEKKGGDAAKPDAGPEMKNGQPVSIGMYYDLPVLLINLKTTNKQPIFLKISLSLQMGKEENRATLDARLPLLIDAFQAFLRELHVEDLRGSMGMYRLREELLLRAAAAASPVEIDDVMFKEIIVK
jgi:flagellar FliL protein